ncbi:deoxyribodipyrimidine photo-lyase [Vibrio paucivorans]|uniref:Deoxyribodipyrimidine photo-lyase n=1 Tax=Vibrio paucivorans TaxID=2829489 RepID=A0A9X3CG60_9VIBR|nr:deoxyribodipyrimidine photo-lyase [Vibrio paucivorans]MCW8334205.1 deoxyribodipyrimidine photo-lyase [Vibrio paucivorans]
MNTILWFRNDLRIEDNPALNQAVKRGASRALFISTPKQWEEHDLAPIQADLIERHLNQLAAQLQHYGMTLVHLKAQNYRDQVTLLNEYCQSHGINTVYANQELELNEQQRDQQLKEYGLELVLFQSIAIAPLGTVLNKQGEMFKVFTPFKRAWLEGIKRQGIDVSPLPQAKHCYYEEDVTSQKNSSKVSDDFELHTSSDRVELDYPKSDSSRWPLSDIVSQQVVPHFMAEKLHLYSQQRDFPAIKGTSGLSPYLAIGAISARAIANQLITQSPELLEDTSHPHFTWLNELIWRDFYKHLLFHYPNLIKGDNFQEKYRHYTWPNNPDYFRAWCEGKTGYPIVDAAMRQLVRTGWMHNRLRMIVASFLTKHLLVDWRWGERFFMQHLIDGDFSANNGGWQWAASTGCDAQPYFRIFNPITQSEKFDPNGKFIRKYLKELESVPDKHIHFPHQYLASAERTETYWPPIVDHKQARLTALDFYKTNVIS